MCQRRGRGGPGNRAGRRWAGRAQRRGAEGGGGWGGGAGGAAGAEEAGGVADAAHPGRREGGQAGCDLLFRSAQGSKALVAESVIGSVGGVGCCGVDLARHGGAHAKKNELKPWRKKM